MTCLKRNKVVLAVAALITAASAALAFQASTIAESHLISPGELVVLTGLSELVTELMHAFGFDWPGAKQVFYGVCLLVVVMA